MESTAMEVRVSICTVLFILFFISVLFAAWDKQPEFRWLQLYHCEMRQFFHHALYTNRLSAAFNYLDEEGKSLFKLMPFFEISRNINKDFWAGKELGIEIGKDVFAWAYLGESIQQVWAKKDYRYYADYEKRDSVESKAKLCLSHSLVSNKFLRLKWFILNDYAYDFDRGSGVRNEVAIGLVMPLGKYIETSINWRHIDRIHYYDSETFEAGVTLVF